MGLRLVLGGYMLENMSNVQAILLELYSALKKLKTTGETYTIYTANTGLTEEEQVEVLETLGRGKVTITFTETDQPASWYESAFSGIWIGEYNNARDEVMAYTIEVARYPMIAAAFDEDIEAAAVELKTWVDAASI